MVVRLAARTRAGRPGEQPLTARAVSTLPRLRCVAPVFAPRGARPPACWAAPQVSLPSGCPPGLGRATARLRLNAVPTSWGSRAPLGPRRAGLCPHQTPVLGHLKTLGRFVFGGSPGLRLDPLGRALPQVLRPGRAGIAPDALRAFGGRDQSLLLKVKIC